MDNINDSLPPDFNIKDWTYFNGTWINLKNNSVWNISKKTLTLNNDPWFWDECKANKYYEKWKFMDGLNKDEILEYIEKNNIT
jgi:hypothetical protein